MDRDPLSRMPVARETLDLITARPGISLIEVAEARGVEVNTALAAVQRLADLGLARIALERREMGPGSGGGNPMRRHCYPITPETP